MGMRFAYIQISGTYLRQWDGPTSSLLMRKANFDSLDPSVPSSGVSNAAALIREVWNEYQKRPVQIVAEAHRAYLKLLSTCGLS